jgi:hypothetical protein
MLYYHLVKGIHICSNKGTGPLQRGDNKKKCKNEIYMSAS